MTTKYRVTFCDFETGRQEAGDGGVMMTLAEILAMMDELLTSTGDFVSVTHEDGTMLQFVVDDHGTCLLDMPSPKERGSYEKHVSVAICKETLESMPDTFDPKQVSGLTFNRW